MLGLANHSACSSMPSAADRHSVIDRSPWKTMFDSNFRPVWGDKWQ